MPARRPNKEWLVKIMLSGMLQRLAKMQKCHQALNRASAAKTRNRYKKVIKTLRWPHESNQNKTSNYNDQY